MHFMKKHSSKNTFSLVSALKKIWRVWTFIGVQNRKKRFLFCFSPSGEKKKKKKRRKSPRDYSFAAWVRGWRDAAVRHCRVVCACSELGSGERRPCFFEKTAKACCVVCRVPILAGPLPTRAHSMHPSLK